MIWAEEGCSFGGLDSSGGETNGQGYVRMVRNLGKTASSDSYRQESMPSAIILRIGPLKSI